MPGQETARFTRAERAAAARGGAQTGDRNDDDGAWHEREQLLSPTQFVAAHFHNGMRIMQHEQVTV